METEGWLYNLPCPVHNENTGLLILEFQDGDSRALRRVRDSSEPGAQTQACEARPVSNNENAKAVVLTQIVGEAKTPTPLLSTRHKLRSLSPCDKPWGLCCKIKDP